MGRLRRGDIVWIDFEKTGAPIKKVRPALVVQNDMANRYAPHVIVVAIRGTAKKGLPVQVAVPRGVAGLIKDSTIDCGFVATVPQDACGKVLGRLPAEWMVRVEAALRISLGLP